MYSIFKGVNLFIYFEKNNYFNKKTCAQTNNWQLGQK